jgi:hypothetical protein
MTIQTPIPFDYAQFILDYPQFATISESKATNVFNYEACTLGQVVSSLWQDNDTKYYWLCVVLAHLLTCEQLGLTGRLSSVTQGSESASFNKDSPLWSQFWDETVYGQKVFQAMSEYLAGGHYVSNGEMPYTGNAMNGMNEIGFFGW